MSDTGAEEKQSFVTGGVLDDMKRRAEAAMAQRDETVAATTDEERAIFEKCAAIIDPLSIGPVFVSPPISGRVYVCRLPRFGEKLAAQASIVKQSDPDVMALMGDMILNISELYASTMGWYPENDEAAIAQVLANIREKSKWPPMRQVDWLVSRSPFTEQDVITLFSLFKAWELEVVPTREQMSKFFATATSAAS